MVITDKEIKKVINSSAYGKFSRPRTMKFRGIRAFMYIKLLYDNIDKIIVRYFEKTKTLEITLYKDKYVDILYIKRQLYYFNLYETLSRQQLLDKVEVISNVSKSRK